MIEITAKSAADAVKMLNSARRENTDRWVFASVNIAGDEYRFKFYNTWVQIAEYPDGRRDSSSMDIKVKDFKEFLSKFFNR